MKGIRKTLAILMCMILIGNLIPPIASANSDYSNLKIRDESTEFVLTVDYSGTAREVQLTNSVIEIKGAGLLGADKNVSDFWKAMPAEEYMTALKALNNISSDATYKHVQGSGKRSNYSGVVGEAPGNSQTDVQLIKEILLFTVVNQIKDGKVNDLATISTDLLALDTTSYSTDYLKALAQKHPEFTGVTDLKEGIRKLTESATTAMVTPVVDDFIYDNYAEGILSESSIDITDDYDEMLQLLVTLSWPKLYESDNADKVFNSIDGITHITGDYLLSMQNVWKEVQSKISTYQEKLALYSIITGRHSKYEDLTMDSNGLEPPTQSSTPIAPNNYKELAEASLKEIIDFTTGAGTGTQLSYLQRNTFEQRIRYHYYALHIRDNIVGNGTAEGLSAGLSEDVHMFGIEPVIMKAVNGDTTEFGPDNAREYVHFMNTINEMVFAREFIFKSGVGTISDPKQTTAEMLEAASYLKNIKAGIVFLESNDVYDFSEIINYWYEVAGTTNNTSLETIYQHAMSIGVMELVDNESIEYVESEPFSNYFNLKDGELSLPIRIGIGNSAKYIPLQTNVYEQSTYMDIDNEDFFTKFHYIWGFNRKAVYIDKSANAPANLFNTNKVGSLSPATLKDILDSNGEIVLYTDTGLYNEHKLTTIADRLETTAEKVTQTAQDAADTAESVQTFVEADYWEKFKMATKYTFNDLSDKIYNADFTQEIIGKVTAYGKAIDKFFNGDPLDKTFLSKEEIDKLFQDTDYSELKPYATLSALYRDKASAEYIQKTGRQPIFVSSTKTEVLPGAEYRERSSLFNYALVKNLQDKKLIDYRINLDLNSPVFVDVYGNILTSSGFVIIPAAANATLYKEFNPYTAAFISTYGSEYSIPAKYEYPDIYDKSEIDGQSAVFKKSKDEEVWMFKELSINSVVDLNSLSTGDKSTQKTLYTLTRKNIDAGTFNNSLYISNVLIQVMQGAPVDEIDYVKEGLKDEENINSKGIVQAYKLDQLKDALATKTQNVLISVPNPAFMQGIEYVIFYLYKISIILAIILLFIQIFVMTMKNEFNIFNLFKIIGTIGLTISFFFVVPWIYEKTYYTTNKFLLQDEAIHLSMLNLEKSEAGSEIGVISVKDPEIKTDLYLKIEDVDIPKTTLFKDIMLSSIDTNLTKVYQDAASGMELTTGTEDVELINNALYMNIKNIYDSSAIVYEPSSKILYQQTGGELVGSFYLPYYMILDSLIANVNKHNQTKETYDFTVNTHSGGRLKSFGLAKGYLLSDELMMDDNANDHLYLKNLYEFEFVTDEATSPFTEDEFALMRNSAWYVDSYIDEDVILNIEDLNKHMKEFVIKNYDLIGKISDETFLKTMALSLAIEYNRLFNIEDANSIEIFSLSPDDLVRLSVASKQEVMEGSTYSYSRFIFEVGGELGVYLTAILEVVLFISGWLKPISIAVLFIVLFMAIFVYRLILSENNQPVKGSLVIILYLCLMNVLYSVLLKLSLMLPGFISNSALCIMLQIIFHIIFILATCYILSLVFRDLKDFGYNSAIGDAHRLKDKWDNRKANYESREEEALRNPESNEWEDLRRKDEADKFRREAVYDVKESEPPTARILDEESMSKKPFNEPSKSEEIITDNKILRNKIGSPDPDDPWEVERQVNHDGNVYFEYVYGDGQVKTTSTRKD